MCADQANDFVPEHLEKWRTVTRDYLFSPSGTMPGTDNNGSGPSEKEALPYPASRGRNSRAILLSWTYRALLHLLRRATQSEQNPLKVLENAFHLQVSFIAKYPSVPRRLLAWYARTGDVRVRSRIQSCITQYEARVSRLISQAKYQGLVSSNIDAQTAATLFVGMLQGMVLRTSASLSQPDMLLREASIAFPVYLNGIGVGAEQPPAAFGETVNTGYESHTSHDADQWAPRSRNSR